MVRATHTTTTTYADYSRDRIGWFFGLSGWQLSILAVTALPVFWTINRQTWTAAGTLAMVWITVATIVVVPVLGRSATGWAAAAGAHGIGSVIGWTSFRSRASQGAAEELSEPDLPGVLAGVQIHDGPPQARRLARVAIIQNHATRTWSVTAQVVHPGIGMSDATERERQGRGLAGLLDVAVRTELIDEVLCLVRSVPDDGAERALWIQRHRRPGVPPLARRINDDLAAGLSGASVRTEQFVTIVVPETRLAREAKDSGGGLEGRARVLYGLMGEVEAQLIGGMGMTNVAWLTSPELALVCRTGFAPGDRASVIDALDAREHDSNVNADVPWAMAGPAAADPLVRHYSHDAWNSVSATIKLPDTGAAIGALAPVLTPGEPGERRSLLVAYPILSARAATRQARNAETVSDMGTAMKDSAKIKVRARERINSHRAASMDAKLATGAALARPYAVCTVTVPKTLPITEFGRRLDASVRRAGYAPLRLDLSQDSAFGASSVPLGVSLTRRGDA